MTGFRDFLLNEAGPNIEWGYMGPVVPLLGGDQAERLSYGSAATFGNRCFLYVKIDPRKGQFASLAKQAKSQLSSCGVECIKGEREAPPTSVSDTWDDEMIPDGGMKYPLLNNDIWQCKKSAPSRKHASTWHDTGEFHVTVLQNFELLPVFDLVLGKGSSPQEQAEWLLTVRGDGGRPLFEDRDTGMKVPVTVPSPARVVYGLSPSFRSEPIIAIAFVECGRAAEARRILAEHLLREHGDIEVMAGLAAKIASIPAAYQWHITIATSARKIRELDDGRMVWTTNLGRLSRTSRGGKELPVPKKYGSNSKHWHNQGFMNMYPGGDAQYRHQDPLGGDTEDRTV